MQFLCFLVYLESVAILPQLSVTSQGKSSDVDKVILFYLSSLASHKIFYILNWMYRYNNEGFYDIIAMSAGVVQAAIYVNFFVMFIIKKFAEMKIETSVWCNVLFLFLIYLFIYFNFDKYLFKYQRFLFTKKKSCVHDKTQDKIKRTNNYFRNDLRNLTRPSKKLQFLSVLWILFDATWGGGFLSIIPFVPFWIDFMVDVVRITNSDGNVSVLLLFELVSLLSFIASPLIANTIIKNRIIGIFLNILFNTLLFLWNSNLTNVYTQSTCSKL